MLRVDVRKNNIAKAISILNRKVKEDGDLRRVVERSVFLPKSTRARIKTRRAQKYKKRDLLDNIEN